MKLRPLILFALLLSTPSFVRADWAEPTEAVKEEPLPAETGPSPRQETWGVVGVLAAVLLTATALVVVARTCRALRKHHGAITCLLLLGCCVLICLVGLLIQCADGPSPRPESWGAVGVLAAVLLTTTALVVVAGARPAPRKHHGAVACGLLLGCCVLVCLVGLLIQFVVIGNRSGREDGPTGAIDRTGPGALPRVDPRTPGAYLHLAPLKPGKAPVYLGDDLACVPELALEDAPKATAFAWQDRKSHTAAAALHLNGRDEDGFLKALLASRPDLAGAPLTLGAACRTKGDEAGAFQSIALIGVARAVGAALPVEGDIQDATEEQRRLQRALVAVVSQVMPAEDVPGQVALVHALSSAPLPEATRALARVAVFSTEPAVRDAAVKALAVRRANGSTEALVAGLGYPWPAAAENAAAAVAKLKRTDLVPQLQAMLAGPDPRGPRAEVVGGRQETVAYELVRVNHLRNCLLCHAPAERGKTPEETLVAEVPVPAESLPDGRTGYGQSESNLLVRIDVTYLRQDFSARQKVTDWTTETWPAVQRFDFFVRKRVLSPAEAADLRERLKGPSPYRLAAERALRQLARGRAEAAPNRP